MVVVEHFLERDDLEGLEDAGPARDREQVGRIGGDGRSDHGGHSNTGSASKGVVGDAGKVLSWTRAPWSPTKKVRDSATSRLKTGSVGPGVMVLIRVRPSRVRRTSPGFRSRAIAQPRPAPEAVIDAGDERLAVVELETQGRAGRVVVDDHDRLEAERAAFGVLAQDLVADLEALDRPEAVDRPDGRAGHEAAPDRRGRGLGRGVHGQLRPAAGGS